MKIAFVDLETTGTDVRIHELWEAAFIIRRDGSSHDFESGWRVLPDLSNADPMALKINGFYRRVQGIGAFDDPEQAAEQIARTLDGAHLAAANVAFDAAFLAKFLRANGHCPTWDYHLIEIESYAAGATAATPPWKLDQLAQRFDIKIPEGRHGAMVDARLARDVFDAARAFRGGNR